MLLLVPRSPQRLYQSIPDANSSDTSLLPLSAQNILVLTSLSLHRHFLMFISTFPRLHLPLSPLTHSFAILLFLNDSNFESKLRLSKQSFYMALNLWFTLQHKSLKPIVSTCLHYKALRHIFQIKSPYDHRVLNPTDSPCSNEYLLSLSLLPYSPIVYSEFPPQCGLLAPESNTLVIFFVTQKVQNHFNPSFPLRTISSPFGRAPRAHWGSFLTSFLPAFHTCRAQTILLQYETVVWYYYRYTSSSRKQRTMVSPHPKGEISNCLGIAADAWFNRTAYRLWKNLGPFWGCLISGGWDSSSYSSRLSLLSLLN